MLRATCSNCFDHGVLGTKAPVDAQAFRADAQLGLEPILLGEPRLGQERVQAGAGLLQDVVGTPLAERAGEVVHADAGAIDGSMRPSASTIGRRP